MPWRSLAILVLVSLLTGCGSRSSGFRSPGASDANCVAAYLATAERQSETDDQRQEIVRALRDMLEKSPAELKSTRYADYQGRPGAWSAVELLRHYFAPLPGRMLTEDCFYRDVAAPAARAAIQRQLHVLNHDLQNH